MYCDESINIIMLVRILCPLSLSDIDFNDLIYFLQNRTVYIYVLILIDMLTYWEKLQNGTEYT